jgi:hypothetical protein
MPIELPVGDGTVVIEDETAGAPTYEDLADEAAGRRAPPAPPPEGDPGI